MTMGLIILWLIVSSIVAYIATKLDRIIGSVLTIVAPVTVLVIMLFQGSGIEAGTLLNVIQFKGTLLGYFFAVIMLIVYSTVAFFNPYWMKKIVHPAAYNFLYLLSLAGTIGVFYAKSFLILFVFWEIVVWSSMFIIPFGKSRKASVVYYALSTFGSFTMLYAIFMLYVKYGTLDIYNVLSQVAADPVTAVIVFILMGLAAMVKLGIFPFHIWLPMAHGNAPDTFSPILSGGLVKLGAFAALLVTVVMPTTQAFSSHYMIMGMPVIKYIVLIIGSISIVVGTLMAIKQDDAKVLLAYSSVANGGYILIGIILADQLSLSGAMMHIFAHAIASAAAFLAIAAVSYRTGTTKMSELGGMIHKMPITYVVYLIAIISMAGIPPMAGFISKWLIFQSLAKNGLILVSAAAFFGSVGSFLYVFRPLSAVFLGQLKPQHNTVKEAPLFMVVPMVILSGITLFFGVFPVRLIDFIGKIQGELGLEFVKTEGTKILGSNGSLDPTLLTLIFGLGFMIAFVIFLIFPKSRKVGLMDTYTAAEFIYSPELYHYAHNFYAPFERLYEKHPDIVKLYKALVQRVVDLGEFVSYVFFTYLPSRGVLWIAVTIILLMWGEKL